MQQCAPSDPTGHEGYVRQSLPKTTTASLIGLAKRVAPGLCRPEGPSWDSKRSITFEGMPPSLSSLDASRPARDADHLAWGRSAPCPTPATAYPAAGRALWRMVM